jgi:TRAP-type mannitol/chloroaromatic compound transport system permease large subunit
MNMGMKNGEIFRGAAPYWGCLMAAILAIVAFPQIATWLPSLGDVVPK